MSKCGICEIDFEGKNRFCSQKCRNTYISRVSSEKRKASNAKAVAEKREKRRLEQVEIEAVRKPTKCENCGLVKKHFYASYRFCSESCAKTFSSNQNREEANKKISKTLSLGNFQFSCKNCKFTEERRIAKRKMLFCSRSCGAKHRNKNSSIFTKYKSLTSFKFSLNTYPGDFDFSLIEKHGWYKAKNHGNNLGGVSRDHRFSVVEGYRQKINPLLIAHPANCKLLVHNENISKGYKSEFSIEILLDEISKWEARNGKYYTFDIKQIVADEEIEHHFRIGVEYEKHV